MEWLSPGVLQVGAGGLVTLIVILILFGYLVPARTVKRIEKERDDWKRAFEEQQIRADHAYQQSAKTIVATETLEQALRSLVSQKGQ